MGSYGGAFLLVNALSSKIYDLIAESTQTIVRAYEDGGVSGLFRSSDFRALLKRYLWLMTIGFAFERLRRVWNFLNLFESLSQYLYVDAHVKPGDEAYEWLLALWSTTPAFKVRSRDFVIETAPKKGMGRRNGMQKRMNEMAENM